MSSIWEIPKNWIWTTTGEIADVVGGGTPRSNNKAFYKNGTIPWITPADLSGYGDKFISHGARNITETGLNNSSAKLMPKGTVLYSSRAPIGYVAIASNAVSTNQGFKSFVLRGSIEPSYMYYYLQRAKEMALDLASGTTFKEISGKNAKQIPFVLPPLPEQHRIVEAIENYFSRLDKAVEALQRVQANLKRYRASVLKSAVEGRLVPTEAELARAEGREYEPASKLLERILKERRKQWEKAELAKLTAKGKTPKNDKWKAKYKDPASPDTTNLPDLPEGWCWATVEQVMWGGSYGTSQKCSYDSPGPPVLRIPNVQHERITLEDLKYATDQEKLPLDGSVQPGDFLFIRTNGSKSLVGRGTAITEFLPNKHYYASYLIRLRLVNFDEFVKWFSLTWHSDTVRTQLLKDAASSAGQHNISLSAAKVYYVPMAPAAEQKRILLEVEKHFSIIDSATKILDKNIGRTTRLRQAILKWAFEGKLADQDPNDEPASELLERIRQEREEKKTVKKR